MGLITHSIVKLALNVPAIIIFSQKGAYFGSQTLPIGKLLNIWLKLAKTFSGRLILSQTYTILLHVLDPFRNDEAYQLNKLWSLLPYILCAKWVEISLEVLRKKLGFFFFYKYRNFFTTKYFNISRL